MLTEETIPTPTSGIVLLATGAPFYGRMAYNLAVTIKAVEPVSITVLHKGAGLSHLSEKQLRIFNTITEITDESFGAKLCLLDYSPYDRTLYFDSDMVWLPGKKPSELFAELEAVTFTSITEGYYDFDQTQDHGNAMYHYWCNPQEAGIKYGLTGKFYQWRSEVMYFTREAAPLFDLAKQIYRNPGVTVKAFAGRIPDELALNIAACKIGIKPHREKWKPAYWHRLHGKGKSLPAMLPEYYLMSAGGNFASAQMKTCYNNVCKAAHRKLGLQYLFPLESKKAVMRDRIKM